MNLRSFDAGVETIGNLIQGVASLFAVSGFLLELCTLLSFLFMNQPDFRLELSK